MEAEATHDALRLDTAELQRLVTDPPIMERRATGFIFTEGPVWVNRGNYLLFSDIPANTIYRWDENTGVSVFRQPSGFTNGHTLDLQGRLLSCEHRNRRVSRTEFDGSITTVASHYAGKRFNSPNDIVVHSNGMIYFTDPPYGRKPNEGDAGPAELHWQGVYCVAPDGSGLRLLVDDFTAPNGLAFSPDEQHLYVDDSADMLVRIFDVLPDGSLSGGRVIIEGMGSQVGVPDGMKVDVDGRLWVTGPGGVWLLDADGNQLGLLPTPEVVANIAWGDADRQTLYLTATSSIYRVRLRVAGAPQR